MGSVFEEFVVEPSYIKPKYSQTANEISIANTIRLLNAPRADLRLLAAETITSLTYDNVQYCEEIFDEGGISAITDLLIESDAKLVEEGLNALINLSVDEQSRYDILETSVLMLLVTFLTNPPNEMILMKTGWLILNLSNCEDVKEEIRTVGGIEKLFSLLARPEARYQRMAIKILNNMLVGCTPYANHEAIAEGNGIYTIIKVALTSTALDVIYYAISVISNLVLSEKALHTFCETKGIRFLLTLLKKYATDENIPLMVLYIFKTILEHDGDIDIPENLVVPEFLSILSGSCDEEEVGLALINLYRVIIRSDTCIRNYLSNRETINTLFSFLSSTNQPLRISSSSVLVKIFTIYKDTSIIKENLHFLLNFLSSNDRKLTTNTMMLLQHIQNDNLDQYVLLSHSTVFPQLFSLLVDQPICQSYVASIILSLSKNKLFIDYIEKNISISVLMQSIQDLTDQSVQIKLIEACTNILTNEKIVQQLIDRGPPLKFLIDYSKDSNNQQRAEKVLALFPLLKRSSNLNKNTPASLNSLPPPRGALQTLQPPKGLPPPVQTISQPVVVAHLPPPNPPADDHQLKIIEKLIEILQTQGIDSLRETISKHANNPRMNFLFDKTSDSYIYFIYQKHLILMKRNIKEKTEYQLYEEEKFKLTNTTSNIEREQEIIREKIRNKILEEQKRVAEEDRLRKEEEEYRKNLEIEQQRIRMEKQRQELELKRHNELQRLSIQQQEEEKELQEFLNATTPIHSNKAPSLIDSSIIDEFLTSDPLDKLDQLDQLDFGDLGIELSDIAYIDADVPSPAIIHEKSIDQKVDQSIDKIDHQIQKEGSSKLPSLGAFIDNFDIDSFTDINNMNNNNNTNLIDHLIQNNTINTNTNNNTNNIIINKNINNIKNHNLNSSITKSAELNFLKEIDTEIDEIERELNSLNVYNESLNNNNNNNDNISDIKPTSDNNNNTTIYTNNSSKINIDDFIYEYDPSNNDNNDIINDNNNDEDLMDFASLNNNYKTSVKLIQSYHQSVSIDDALSDFDQIVTTLQPDLTSSNPKPLSENQQNINNNIDNNNITIDNNEKVNNSDSNNNIIINEKESMNEIKKENQSLSASSPSPISSFEPISIRDSYLHSPRHPVEPLNHMNTSNNNNNINTSININTSNNNINNNMESPRNLKDSHSPRTSSTPLNQSYNRSGSATLRKGQNLFAEKLSKSVIVKCTYKNDVKTLKMNDNLKYSEFIGQIASKYKNDCEFRGCKIKYQDDMGDLIEIEAQDDLEMAFEICGKRLLIFINDYQTNEINQSTISSIIPPPPPPSISAPPPPPPPSSPSIEPKVSASYKEERSKLARPTKNINMAEEMKLKQLKSVNRTTQTMRRGRKEIKKEENNTDDMMKLMMAALNSRREFIKDVEEDESNEEWI